MTKTYIEKEDLLDYITLLIDGFNASDISFPVLNSLLERVQSGQLKEYDFTETIEKSFRYDNETKHE